MGEASRTTFLRIALFLVGLIFIVGIYTFTSIWPSGWSWHGPSHHITHYVEMILGVYATLGVFLLVAGRKLFAREFERDYLGSNFIPWRAVFGLAPECMISSVFGPKGRSESTPTRFSGGTQMKYCLPVVLGLFFCGMAYAQEHSAHTQSKPATLMQGYGDQHHPVSTSSDQAQQFFDQGLRQIYAFNHDEAARSFQRAPDVDPQLAMTYWGVAEAVGPNYKDPASDDPFATAH